MEPNLVVSIYIRSSIKFLHFVPFHQQIWPPGQFLFLIGYCLKNSSPLKLLGQMEPNLAGSIYVRSSIILLHLVPFGQQTWPPRLIPFSDWLMLKKSSPLKQLGQMEPNLAGSIYVRSKPGIDGPGCVPFKIVSDSPTLHSRWLLFFKVMIISL